MDRKIKLGAYSIERIVECGHCRFSPGQLFRNLSAERVQNLPGWIDGKFVDRATGDIFLSFHSYVIRASELTILIDACSGNHKQRPALPMHHDLRTNYLGRLAAVGLRPEDIDVVLCTHLHPDHTGWNTRLANGRWVPTFPNARYVASAVDFEFYERFHASRPSDPVAADVARSFEDSVLPIAEAGLMDLVAVDHRFDGELANGVWFESASGHSPGQVVIHINSQGHRAVFSADVIHHPLQLSDLELSVTGDADVAKAIEDRRRLLEANVDTGALIFPAHFPDPTVGRLISAGEEIRFDWQANNRI